MRRPIAAAVREAARLDDPAELELFGATMFPGAVASEPDHAAELVALIAEARQGQSLLRALSAAAPPPVSTLAAEAIREGPVSLAAERVGTLAPERAFSLDADEPVTSVMVTCRRPGTAGCQLLAFTLEWPATGGAIKEATTAPLEEGELESKVLAVARAEGIEPEEISTEEAVELIAAGARRCADFGAGPDREDSLPVALLLRAAARPDADALLEPLAGLPSLVSLIEDVIDEAEVQQEIDAFNDAVDAWCGEQGFGEEWHDLVRYAGGTMADFQAWYAEVELTDWDAEQLADYLLGYVPRKVGLDDEDVERFPLAAADVFRFLGDTGRLPAREAVELSRLAVALTDRFAAAASDPRNFGPAKAFAAAMEADGVDLGDRAAVQAWIESFNALPEAERKQRMPLPGDPPAPPPKPAAAKKKAAVKARRSQRQARRRSRRK